VETRGSQATRRHGYWLAGVLALGALIGAVGLALFLRPVNAEMRLGGSVDCGYAVLHSETAQSQDGGPLCDSPLRSATWAAVITTIVGAALLVLGALLTAKQLVRVVALASAALISVVALLFAWQANR
jgi:hypothetical protein